MVLEVCILTGCWIRLGDPDRELRGGDSYRSGRPGRPGRGRRCRGSCRFGWRDQHHNRSTIPAYLRELMILRAVVLNRAELEFAARTPRARSADATELKIQAVSDWAQHA